MPTQEATQKLLPAGRIALKGTVAGHENASITIVFPSLLADDRIERETHLLYIAVPVAIHSALHDQEAAKYLIKGSVVV